MMEMSRHEIMNHKVLADLPRNIRDRIAVKAWMRQQRGEPFTLKQLKTNEGYRHA